MYISYGLLLEFSKISTRHPRHAWRVPYQKSSSVVSNCDGLKFYMVYRPILCLNWPCMVLFPLSSILSVITDQHVYWHFYFDALTSNLVPSSGTNCVYMQRPKYTNKQIRGMPTKTLGPCVFYLFLFVCLLFCFGFCVHSLRLLVDFELHKSDSQVMPYAVPWSKSNAR